MTSKTINGTGTTMAFNAADELTTAGSATYSYDANGNQTGVSGGNTFTYNAKDQTASITPNGGSAISMGYRGPGQAERVTAGGTSYQYDATGLSQSSSGSPVYYTTTPDGEVLSERLYTGTYYYLHDGLGSVVGLTNSSGSVVNSYAYDPYGNTTSSSGTVANPFRYIGAVWDSSTGLYKMGSGTTIRVRAALRKQIRSVVATGTRGTILSTS